MRKHLKYSYAPLGNGFYLDTFALKFHIKNRSMVSWLRPIDPYGSAPLHKVMTSRT